MYVGYYERRMLRPAAGRTTLCFCLFLCSTHHRGRIVGRRPVSTCQPPAASLTQVPALWRYDHTSVDRPLVVAFFFVVSVSCANAPTHTRRRPAERTDCARPPPRGLFSVSCLSRHRCATSCLFALICFRFASFSPSSDYPGAHGPKLRTYAYLSGTSCVLMPFFSFFCFIIALFLRQITPAHDPNDYMCGKRHGLPFVTVLGLDGAMNAQVCPL